MLRRDAGFILQFEHKYNVAYSKLFVLNVIVMVFQKDFVILEQTLLMR